MTYTLNDISSQHNCSDILSLKTLPTILITGIRYILKLTAFTPFSVCLLRKATNSSLKQMGQASRIVVALLALLRQNLHNII